MVNVDKDANDDPTDPPNEKVDPNTDAPTAGADPKDSKKKK